ncbi:hypothetical protein D3C81_1451900 [compost metagenome]
MAENKKTGLGKEIPPDLFHVKVYFSCYNQDECCALAFYDYYQSLNWRNRNGTTLSNWKILAWQWIHYKIGL